MAYCCAKGHGVGQSSEDAIAWLRQGAATGYAGALYDLGACYEIGYGEIEKNLELAEGHYREAAEAGDVGAMWRLGMLYEGVHERFDLAVEQYEKAARKGLPQAKYKLGCCYLDGLGIDQNKDLGMRLILEAGAGRRRFVAKYGEEEWSRRYAPFVDIATQYRDEGCAAHLKEGRCSLM